MNRDLISVIVLAYNTEKYIKKCLDSIIKQTYTNTQIIVMLDGSLDKTKSIVKRMAKKDERILIVESENRGTCRSRIEGCKLAKGRYVTYVDGDDYIEKNMLEVMYKKLKEYNVDIVHCQYKEYEQGKISIPKNILNRNVCMDLDHFEPQFFDLLYTTDHCNQIGRQLIKRKLLNKITKIDKNLMYSEDLLCNLYMYKEMKSIVFIPDELYIYNKDSMNIKNNNDYDFLLTKLDNVIDVYYELYKSIMAFNMKDRKYYKKMASIKFICNILALLNILAKHCNYKKFKIVVENIMTTKEVKEVLKYLENNPINDELKNLNNTLNCIYIMLNKNKIKTLYYYNKYKKIVKNKTN